MSQTVEETQEIEGGMEQCKVSGGPNMNPHLRTMKQDCLYHLALSTQSSDLKEMFGDVKFVCMGGTPQRMENFAYYIMKEIGYKIPTGTALKNISKQSHRYSLFKSGPVLSVSHGMGVPSVSILLHEMIKLMWHAGAKDPVFFRIGTCGGIGLEPGTVVVTNEAVDGKLRPVSENIILGKKVFHEAKLDQDLVKELITLNKGLPFQVVSGKTVCTDDFYEGQARLDGAFCEHTEAEKIEYLNYLHINGVANIEMESTVFASLTHRAGFKSAVVCVTLLNRLNEDQVTPSKETLTSWQNRPQQVVANYIKKVLELNANGQNGQMTEDNTELVAAVSSYDDEINTRLRTTSLNLS